MLQSVSGAFDLPSFGGAAQLSRQLVTLSKAGSAERVSFGQQSTRRVGDDFSAIGIVAIFDESFRASFGTQAQRFVGDQFVLCETIVQFDNADIVGPDARLFVYA